MFSHEFLITCASWVDMCIEKKITRKCCVQQWHLLTCSDFAGTLICAQGQSISHIQTRGLLPWVLEKLQWCKDKHWQKVNIGRLKELFQFFPPILLQAQGQRVGERLSGN